ncbi:hypothetical protein C8F04DRAFT_1187375 [Mycena alexandri]|uniref:Uncharacterized protein n=1 Tax=Mycena alexandri TaxID=1745969 RepID=A0AAD6SLX2_9AGAR|nr:hypothetical protein C8F04DRAFT_1187375 [Mycena alexandri]
MWSWPPRAIRSCVGAGLPEEDEGGGVGAGRERRKNGVGLSGRSSHVQPSKPKNPRSMRGRGGGALDLVGGVVGKGRGREGTYETGVGDKSGGKGRRARRGRRGAHSVQPRDVTLAVDIIPACAENRTTTVTRGRSEPDQHVMDVLRKSIMPAGILPDARPLVSVEARCRQHGQHGQHAPSSRGPVPALLSASEGGGGCGDGCGDTMGGHHGGKGGHFTLLRTLSVEVVYLVVYRGHHEGNGGHFTLLRTLSVEVVYLVVYRGHHVGKGGQKCRWGIWRCIWWCTGDTMGVKGDRSIGRHSGRGTGGISLEACGALLFCDMSQNNPFEIVSECQGIDDGLKAPVGALGLCVHGVQGTLALVQGTGYCWTLPVFVLEKWVIVTQGTPYLMI